MAPTEILAEQHYRKFGDWLAPLGVRVGVAARQPARARSAGAGGARERRGALVVGTHALFQEDVAVRQARPRDRRRAAPLRRRSSASRCARRARGAASQPHQLMMSATPIPRTLAMTLLRRPRRLDDRRAAAGAHAGRDASCSPTSKRDEVLERIRDACARGQQAYWVCPLIEESEALRPADRDRHLRDAARRAAGPARRPAARPHAGGGEGRGDGSVHRRRRSSCWSRPR